MGVDPTPRGTVQDADALHRSGVAAFRDGRAAQAIALLREAVRIRPNFARALNDLGAALGSLEQFEEAAGAFRIPLYPFKLLIPIVAFLFLLEGISYFRKRND